MYWLNQIENLLETLLKEYWSSLEDQIILEKTKNDQEIKRLDNKKANLNMQLKFLLKAKEIKDKAEDVYEKAFTFVATFNAENRAYKKKLDLNK